MGKNQAYKAMQRAKMSSHTGSVADDLDDGMMDGSFHSPEWHAARLASLQTSHTITWEEFKQKQKEEARKQNELEDSEARLMREYRAQLDAERAAKLSRGRNHKKDSRFKKGKKEKEKDKKRPRRKKSEKKRRRSDVDNEEDGSCSSEATGDDASAPGGGGGGAGAGSDEKKEKRSSSKSRREKRHKRRRSESPASATESSSSDDEKQDGPMRLSTFFDTTNGNA